MLFYAFAFWWGGELIERGDLTFYDFMKALWVRRYNFKPVLTLPGSWFQRWNLNFEVPAFMFLSCAFDSNLCPYMWALGFCAAGAGQAAAFAGDAVLAKAASARIFSLIDRVPTIDTKPFVDGTPGRVVQVDSMKPTLKAPGYERLTLKCDDLLSSFAFKFNLRRYTRAPSRRAWRSARSRRPRWKPRRPASAASSRTTHSPAASSSGA